MQVHPIDLEARALKAHRHRVRSDGASLSASLEQIDGRFLVAVRERGATVAAYLVQRHQLRRARQVPASIW